MQSWQKHVGVGQREDGNFLAACGQVVRKTEWVFNGAAHASHAVEQAKPLRPCPDCARALGIECGLRACRRFTLQLAGQVLQVVDTRASSMGMHERQCERCDRRAHWLYLSGATKPFQRCSNHRAGLMTGGALREVDIARKPEAEVYKIVMTGQL